MISCCYWSLYQWWWWWWWWWYTVTMLHCYTVTLLHCYTVTLLIELVIEGSITIYIGFRRRHFKSLWNGKFHKSISSHYWTLYIVYICTYLHCTISITKCKVSFIYHNSNDIPYIKPTIDSILVYNSDGPFNDKFD